MICIVRINVGTKVATLVSPQSTKRHVDEQTHYLPPILTFQYPFKPLSTSLEPYLRLCDAKHPSKRTFNPFLSWDTLFFPFHPSSSFQTLHATVHNETFQWIMDCTNSSDVSGEEHASPLAKQIAAFPFPRQYEVEIPSHSGSLDAIARNLQRTFESEPLAPEPIVRREDPRLPQRPQRAVISSIPESRTVPESSCDMCFGKHEQKNAVKAVDRKHFEAYSSIEMVDKSADGVTEMLFGDILDRLQSSVEASSAGDVRASVGIAICRKCERQLQTLISLRKNKRREREKDSIFMSFFRRRQKYASASTHEHTIQSLRCFLHGKGSIDCTNGGHYRPLRLANRSESILKARKEYFASKAGIGSYLVSKLLENCRSEVLCPSHTSLMSNSLLFCELAATKCSICGRQEKKRGKQDVTMVNHDVLRTNEDTICLVEDALAVYTDNSIQISDVRQLCAPCRLVIFRQVSLRENRPRHESSAKMRFDYGPTPSGIRKSINWVRRMLSKEGKLVVFLKEVWSFYHGIITEAEKPHEIKDPRTLKKYILPSLASTGIFLEMGSRKVGSYFCTTASFSALAKDMKRNTIYPSFMSVDNMSSDREKELLRELGDVFKSKVNEIEQSAWSLRDFIVLVPADLWRRKVIFRGSNRMLSRCKAAANIRKVHFYDEWPCNPKECPQDLQLRPNHEQRFVSTIFCMLEQDAFEVSNRSSQGPLNYSLTLCGYMRAEKEFMRLLNKVGITGSYQTPQRIKNAAICQHIEKGAFAQTMPRAFHTIAVDNVNVQAGHSLAVHGSTYQGFNGTAAQAVASNVRFNFAEFLRSKAQSELEVRRLEGMKRETFIEEMFPNHEDPDLTGYRWIVVGLALQHRESLVSKEENKQRSFRSILLDAFKGYSGGKSRVTYVDVNRSNAQDPLSIVRQLGLIEEALIAPKSTTTFVGVVGDQPVFKILFELWYESYLKKSKLHKWMIPIPGGFHIDKQGLIPLNKTFLAGAGQEEMVAFSGLSQTHQEGFFGLPHYRKSRRVLHQICAAEILRVTDVVAENPAIGKELQSFLSVRERGGSMGSTGNSNECVEEGTLEGGEKCKGGSCSGSGVQEVLPNGCTLELTDLVSKETVMIGKLICDEVENLSKHSKNFRYLAKSKLS